ncbi:PQQ-like domain-containing protein [Micromonospora nigra]|uniref:PQQ-like domain-containing protein n=1 Tax=Micromonospora nigra TaxID=145857 RepID=A0A1C6SNU0_9ACTN|nr:PQQ-binding-like beta-propeller repeat protein [Micromonospora nigra]SCL31211.1 PQQ-like domain-containing protein [Micromonospora nigra]
MTLIDLGDMDGNTDARALPPPSRAVGRPVRVALTVLLVLVTLTASAGPVVQSRATVPAAAGAAVFLSGERLFVVQPPPTRADDGRSELVTYPVPQRAAPGWQRPEPLWRVPLPPGSRSWRVEVVSAGVLVSVSGREQTTLLLDADTGRTRWTAPGIAITDGSDQVLLQTLANQPTLRAVELATGRERWAVPVPMTGVDQRFRDGVIDRVVRALPGGPVEVLDSRTGSVLHQLDPSAGQRPIHHQVQVAGDLVLMVRSRPATLVAYEVDGLRQRWSTALPRVGRVTPCGVLLCVVGQTGGVRALDPATGAVRWYADELRAVLSVAGGPLVGIRPSDDGDRIQVLDPATGRVTADLGTWQLVPWADRDQPLLVTRGAAGGGLVLAEVIDSAGGVRIREVMHDAVGGCVTGGGAVACLLREDTGGGVGVWQLD